MSGGNVEVVMTDVLAAVALVSLSAVFWWVGIHVGSTPERIDRRGRAVRFEGDP
jgi:hypothetical protein